MRQRFGTLLGIALVVSTPALAGQIDQFRASEPERTQYAAVAAAAVQQQSKRSGAADRPAVEARILRVAPVPGDLHSYEVHYMLETEAGPHGAVGQTNIEAECVASMRVEVGFALGRGRQDPAPVVIGYRTRPEGSTHDPAACPS